MAITAQISTFPTRVMPGQPVKVKCTFTNSGASDVDVWGVRPVVTISGQTAEQTCAGFGLPPLGPGRTVTVDSGGGTLDVEWLGTFPAPQGPDPLTLTYACGAVCNMSNGNTVYAQAALVVVTPIPTGQPQFTPQAGTAPTQPSRPTAPTFPDTGAMQFDYHLNAAVGVAGQAL